jgi:hypothetical protein
MILCSAFLFAPLAAVNAASRFGFGFEPAHADYGKFLKRSNRNLKKRERFSAGQYIILRPAPGFGFILPCRDGHKPSRPS